MKHPRTISDCLVGMSALPERDRMLLDRLVPDKSHHLKHSVVFRQGERSDQLLVVDSGHCFTCRYLEDGSRQIIDIHFPGEVIGLDELSQPHHLSNLITMTEASFLHYDKDEVVQLFAWSPALSRVLFDVVSLGQVLLTERMVGIARHCALQRVAYFLLEVQHRALRGYESSERLSRRHSRQQPAGSGPRSGPPSVLRIPHNVIADSLGLSIVHVSRILSQLRDRGLIGSCGHAISLVDVAGLQAVAGWRPEHQWVEPASITA